MFDLGWTELLVIGIVALIVVGPKDLPVLFKKGGQFVGRLKGMAREFSSAMNEAADDAGVTDINKTLKAAGCARTAPEAWPHRCTACTEYKPAAAFNHLRKDLGSAFHTRCKACETCISCKHHLSDHRSKAPDTRLCAQ